MGEKSLKTKQNKTKQNRSVEFCHGAALLRKLDHSVPSELLDICVLSLEDGWLIRAIFTVGRRVEDCVCVFFYSFPPLSMILSAICMGASCVASAVEEVYIQRFLDSDSILSSKHLS